MARCDVCGKSTVFGLKHRHHRGVAGGQWARRTQKTVKVFRPNLHHAWIVKNGKRVRVSLCTKCLRKVKSQNPPQKNEAKPISPAQAV